jgi:hypothetical protein
MVRINNFQKLTIMTAFIELHDFSGNTIFLNTDKIICFSPDTHDKEGVPCTLISTGYRSGVLPVRETPSEILDKIRESEYNTLGVMRLRKESEKL